jgi:hypothetical protein
MMMIMMMASGFVTRLKSCSPCICIHHHHHHHQWRYSPINEPWPLLGSFSLEDSQQIPFYRVRLSASRPTPNLEDQVSVFIPLEAGLPSYASGQWVARVPWDRHFPYPLTWAPEEMYLYYSLQLLLFNLQRRTVWSMQTEYIYIVLYWMLSQTFSTENKHVFRQIQYIGFHAVAPDSCHSNCSS